MSDATDINSLPTNPGMGTADAMPNIVMAKNEKIDNKLEYISKSRDEDLRAFSQGPANQNQANSQMPNALDQSLINKLISGIQQASVNGLTSLPSSHIPMDTNSITSDVQTKPNYIPQSHNNNYIDDEESTIQLSELSASPEDENIAKENVEIIMKSLPKLRKRYRDLIQARIDGKSYKQISYELDIPESTLKSTLSKARVRLKEIINKIT